MADVFISYSRKDDSFVRRLHGAMSQAGRDVWVDWEDIPLTADWWREIRAGIDEADTFLFVISPDSARSEVCYNEVDYASKNNKRIVPIVFRDLVSADQEKLHPSVNRHNWTFFRDTARFEQDVANLMSALDTNLNYVRDHTRLLVRAKEWAQNNREVSFLLRGVDLRSAENLLITSAQYDDPKPTDLQTEYIFASRRGANQRQRLTLGGVAFAFVVALALAILALVSFQQAEANLLLSRRTQSLFLADLSRQQLEAEHFRAALLLALESVAHFPAVSNGESNRAILDALTAPPQKLIALRHDVGPISGVIWNRDETRILSVAGDQVLIRDANGGEILLRLQHAAAARGGLWNRDESRILTWSDDDTARVWDPFIENELHTLRHQAAVNGAFWIDDGARVVTWSDDSAVRVWNPANGDLLARFGHVGPVRGVAWHAGTQRLAAWAENTITIWTLDSDRSAYAQQVSLTHDARVQGAVWNMAGTQVLSWSRDATARIWDADSGDTVQTLLHDKTVNGAVWNASEDRVLSWTRSATARVWRLTDASYCSLVHDGNVNGALWDMAGERVLSWSGDRTVRVWDDPCSGESNVVQTYARSVEGAQWNDDESQILSWGADNTVRVWDATSQTAAFVFEHGGPVSQADWSQDERRVISTSLDNTVQVWRAVATSPSRREVVLDLAHDQRVNGAVWNAEQTRILSWSVDSFVHLWDASDTPGNRLVLSLEHEGPVNGAAWNPDESLILTWSVDGTARLWNTDGELGSTLAHDGEVLGALWGAGGERVLTWSTDGTVRLWNVDGMALGIMEYPTAVAGAVWSPDQLQVLTWSGNELRLWAADDSLAGAVWRHDGTILGAAWSADGSRFLAWSEDKSVRAWSVDNAFLPLLLLPHESVVGGAAWSPDETRILTWASGNRDNNVQVWNAQRGERLAQLPHGNSSFGVQGAIWNGDGTRVLAWSSNGIVRVWDIEREVERDLTGGEPQPLVNLQHDRFVAGAIWNSDETRVLSWSTDDTARIWDVSAETGGEALFVFRQTNAVNGAAWNRDESRVLTWNSDGVVKQWVVDVPVLIDIGRRRVVEPLTGAERDRFFLPAPTALPADN